MTYKHTSPPLSLLACEALGKESLGCKALKSTDRQSHDPPRADTQAEIHIINTRLNLVPKNKYISNNYIRLTIPDPAKLLIGEL